MRNGNDLLIEGLKRNDHGDGGSPQLKYGAFLPPGSQCAQKLILSNEGCKILLITMLFEDLNSKLVQEIIKTYVFP